LVYYLCLYYCVVLVVFILHIWPCCVWCVLPCVRLLAARNDTHKNKKKIKTLFPFDVRTLKYLKILEIFLNLAFYTYLLNAPKSFSHISFILRTDIIVSSLPLSSYSGYLFYLSYIFRHFLPACLSQRTSPTQLPAYSRLLGDACDVCWVRSW
jgi:hypothetical protein